VRGCLTVLILAALFVVAGAWFGGPPIAEAVVGAGLATAGLSADHLDVDVEASPPLELALGRADRVLVDATDADWHGIKAERIDLALSDVDFVDRSAGHVSGRMTGVELPRVEPAGSLATIDIDGPGDDATATITIDGPTFDAIAVEAFDEKLGIRPSSVTLAEPNVLRVLAGPISASSGVTVESDGSLGVATPLGTVTVLDAESTSPLHLTNVAVENGSLVLTGTVDLADLIG
jgi:LmeA-like phospholipid-binding